MLVISSFVGKIKLNFQYKTMTKKMYYNLLQKYKKSVFQILKIKLHKNMTFPIEDFFRTCDQIRRKLRIWSHWLKKSLMENFIFCVAYAKRLAILILIRQLQKKIHWVFQLFGNKVIERISLTSRTEHPDLFTHALI